MKGFSFCEGCGKRFSWYRKNNATPARFCSMECRKEINFSAEKLIKKLIFYYEKDVIKKEGCWDWKGRKSGNGYSKLSCRTTLGAHNASIASHLIYRGKIPKGLFVCHKCDNPVCTNPDHLFLGTHLENMHDRDSKKRNAIGSKNGTAILNENQVKEIKNMIKSGVTVSDISKQYCVKSPAIYKIKNNINWRHV